MKYLSFFLIPIFLFSCSINPLNKKLDVTFVNKTSAEIYLNELWADRGRVGNIVDETFPILLPKNEKITISFEDSEFDRTYSCKLSIDEEIYRIPRLTEGTIDIFFNEESEKYEAHLYSDYLLPDDGELYDVIPE